MSAEKQHVRAFVSVHLPADIREKLRDTQKSLASGISDHAVRWTPFEQLHLTLEFLGNVGAEHLTQLQQALAKAAASHRAFKLFVEAVGAFSSVRNPRVVWAGVKGDVQALFALQADVRAAVAPCVTERETRAYKAHITLGRVRPINRSELRGVTEALGDVGSRAFGSWSVEEFALMQSQLSSHGSQHSTLATFPLGS